jgi:hypothetical protein
MAEVGEASEGEAGQEMVEEAVAVGVFKDVEPNAVEIHFCALMEETG